MNHPDSIAEAALSARVFPGAALYLSKADRLLHHAAYGRLGYEAPFLEPVSLETQYDLASLTKIYVLALALKLSRELDRPLTSPVSLILPGFDPRLTPAHLLGHASGITVSLQSLAEAPVEHWVSRLAAAPLGWAPGERVLYSCGNTFLAARLLEAWTGESLDSLLEIHLFRPLGLTDTTSTPRPDRVAPTEANGAGYRRGQVHDEAARAWAARTGTVCGNAGLFATAADVARFARIWLAAWPGRSGTAPGHETAGAILTAGDLARVAQSPLPEQSFLRGLGWQIGARFYIGERAPAHTWGHLGFTGPSLVVNPATSHLAVILNNRVHPSREGPNRMPYHAAWHDWLFTQT